MFDNRGGMDKGGRSSSVLLFERFSPISIASSSRINARLTPYQQLDDCNKSTENQGKGPRRSTRFSMQSHLANQVAFPSGTYIIAQRAQQVAANSHQRNQQLNDQRCSVHAPQLAILEVALQGLVIAADRRRSCWISPVIEVDRYAVRWTQNTCYHRSSKAASREALC